MRIAAIAFLVGSALAAAPLASAADMATAEIVNTDGAVIGKVSFEQTPTGVLMSVEVTGLPPGGRGIHLHAVGSCTPDFKAAAGHINPGGARHGLRNPEGPDNGDLPNLYAAADGSARAEFFTSRVSVTGGDMPALLDEDGSAAIIHENPDDHMSQPIGGAGGRIGCGIVSKMQPQPLSDGPAVDRGSAAGRICSMPESGKKLIRYAGRAGGALLRPASTEPGVHD